MAWHWKTRCGRSSEIFTTFLFGQHARNPVDRYLSTPHEPPPATTRLVRSHILLRFYLAFFALNYSGVKVAFANNMYVLTLCLSLALASGQLASCWAPPAPAHKRRGGSGEQYEVKDKRGAVASESSVCSHIGTGLIKDGGNAADAVSLTTLRKRLPLG